MMKRTHIFAALLFCMACSDSGSDQKKEEQVSQAVSLDMVLVEGGTFNMFWYPNVNHLPEYPVTLSSYRISKYEVTRAQWKAVMNEDFYEGACPQCPIDNISWDKIHEFIDKLNQNGTVTYRLPTEAEWEFAFRGGTKSKGYEYSGSNSPNEVAWTGQNSGSTPGTETVHEVGKLKANELGLYDMSGNVTEVTADWLATLPVTGAATNPTGPATGFYKVSRGGTFVQHPVYATYYSGDGRLAIDPTAWNLFTSVGFRLAANQ